MKSFDRVMRAGLIAGVLGFASSISSSPGTAETLRLAAPADVLSLDPHSNNVSFTNYFLANVYDGLVHRDRDFRIAGQLAESWRQPDPLTWVFALRRDVKFHDGSAFTAADVIFSFDRSREPTSNFKHVLASVADYRAVDAQTVEIRTKRPNPILLNDLLDLMIMSKAWSEKNGASAPVDLAKQAASFAALNANGTGPYRVVWRARNERTVLEAASGYWGKRANIDRVIFTPIENASTLVSALLGGEVDLVMPLPLQDLKRVSSNPNLKVASGPETRVMFLGMDQARDELLESSVKGRNPFKDKRVREAFAAAIDARLIVDRVMEKQASVATQLVMEQINGFNPDLQRLPADTRKARRLLAEAGYPDGFELGMDCPNNRWVNDGEICQAVVAMLARVGVKVNLLAQPAAQFYPKVIAPGFTTSFYLLSWTPATMDSLNMIQNVLATRNRERGEGQWNIAGCSVPDAEKLWTAAATEMDEARRTQLLRQAMKLYMDDYCLIPLHAQRLVWGARRGLEVVQHPTSEFPIEMMVLTP